MGGGPRPAPPLAPPPPPPPPPSRLISTFPAHLDFFPGTQPLAGTCVLVSTHSAEQARSDCTAAGRLRRSRSTRRVLTPAYLTCPSRAGIRPRHSKQRVRVHRLMSHSLHRPKSCRCRYLPKLGMQRLNGAMAGPRIQHTQVCHPAAHDPATVRAHVSALRRLRLCTRMDGPRLRRCNGAMLQCLLRATTVQRRDVACLLRAATVHV